MGAHHYFWVDTHIEFFFFSKPQVIKSWQVTTAKEPQMHDRLARNVPNELGSSKARFSEDLCKGPLVALSFSCYSRCFFRKVGCHFLGSFGVSIFPVLLFCCCHGYATTWHSELARSCGLELSNKLCFWLEKGAIWSQLCSHRVYFPFNFLHMDVLQIRGEENPGCFFVCRRWGILKWIVHDRNSRFNQVTSRYIIRFAYLDFSLRLAKCWSQDTNPPEQWKNPGWLGYEGDYTIQLYRDYKKPI